MINSAQTLWLCNNPIFYIGYKINETIGLKYFLFYNLSQIKMIETHLRHIIIRLLQQSKQKTSFMTCLMVATQKQMTCLMSQRIYNIRCIETGCIVSVF